MVDNTTVGVSTAGAGTRVATLLFDAGQLTGTLSAEHTLGAAGGWGTDVVRQARARRDTTGYLALRVGAAR